MKRILTCEILLMFFFYAHCEHSYYYSIDHKTIPLSPINNKVLIRKNATASIRDFETMCKKSHSSITTTEWNKDSTYMAITFAKDINLSDLKLYENLFECCFYKYKIGDMEVGVNNELIAKLKDETLISKYSRKYGIISYNKTYSGDYIIKIPQDVTPIAYANILYETGAFIYVYPRFFCDYTLFAVYPNDPFFPMQYALHNIGQTFTDNHTGTIDADINAPEAWEITMGDSCIVIAVIDEGVTSNHPDLPNSRQIRLAGSNFGSGDPDDPSPTWNDAHGTCCAGAIAATTNNNEGIAGIAPNCKIMPIRVENGTSVPSENQIANAFAFAINNGANIISCSLGFDNKYNQPNAFPDIVNKIQEAIDAGICVILAAGNNSECGDNKVAFPANCNVNYKITVGASDRYDQRACYSPINSKIDIVAPSHRAYPSQIATENLEIWALDIPGFYGYNPDKTTYEKLPDSGNNYLAYTGRFGGTSYSCPTVAGVAALMLSVNPDLSPQEVYTILTQTADKVGGYTYTNGRCNEMGYGRLDAYTAVLAARNKYIQNVTYSNGSNVVEIYPNIYAGYAVTNNKPYGNVVVQVGSNVTFKARNRIELHPGFRVEQGATFRAVIESPSQQSSAPSYVRRKELFTANNEEDNHDDAVIEQPQKNTFSISPNPVRDILNIHISEELSQVKIYNLNGQCVLRANQMDIDVSALPQGMYILRTETTSGAPLQAKFIKQ